MSQTRIFATLALALVIALVASYVVAQKLRQPAVNAAAAPLVVLASRNLEVGAKLQEEDVKLAAWAAGTPPQGAFSNLSDAVGRAVLYPTFEGEIILESKLASLEAGAGLSAVIPEGMRAVSIRVDDVVAVAGFVVPGTRVDVLLTGNPATSGGASQLLTKTILQNVQVLAAGQKIQPDAQGRPERVNVVTLLCTIEDAAKVTLAANEGRIQLVLRNPTDTKRAEKAAGVMRQALYSDAPVAAPRKVTIVREVVAPPPPPPPPPVEPPKPAPPTVEVFSGRKKEVLEVSPTAAVIEHR